MRISSHPKTFPDFREQLEYFKTQLSKNRLVNVVGTTYFLNYTADYRQDRQEFLKFLETRPFHTMHIFLLVDILDDGYLIYDTNFNYFGKIPPGDFIKCVQGLRGIDFLKGHPVLKKVSPYQVLELETKNIREIDLRNQAINFLKDHSEEFTYCKQKTRLLGRRLYRIYFGLRAVKEVIADLKAADLPVREGKVKNFIDNFLRDLIASLRIVDDFLKTFIGYFPSLQEHHWLLGDLQRCLRHLNETTDRIKHTRVTVKITRPCITELEFIYREQSAFYSKLKVLLRDLKAAYHDDATLPEGQS